MAVAQLVRIRRLRELGLGLEQIREVLDPAAPTSVDAALAMVRAELDVQVRRLQAVGAAIDAVRASAAWGRGDPKWQRLLAAVADADITARKPIDAGAAADEPDEPPLPEGIAAALQELARRPEWVALSGQLAGLREADWDDPRISDIAAQLAELVPVELRPDELTAPEGFALLAGRRASPAQVRCLLQAGHRARPPAGRRRRAATTRGDK
jgi:DNA-binding transcriptional MerR regulator